VRRAARLPRVSADPARVKPALPQCLHDFTVANYPGLAGTAVAENVRWYFSHGGGRNCEPGSGPFEIRNPGSQEGRSGLPWHSASGEGNAPCRGRPWPGLDQVAQLVGATEFVPPFLASWFPYSECELLVGSREWQRGVARDLSGERRSCGDHTDNDGPNPRPRGRRGVHGTRLRRQGRSRREVNFLRADAHAGRPFAERAKDLCGATGREVNRRAEAAKSDRLQVQACQGHQPKCMSFLPDRGVAPRFGESRPVLTQGRYARIPRRSSPDRVPRCLSFLSSSETATHRTVRANDTTAVHVDSQHVERFVPSLVATATIRLVSLITLSLRPCCVGP
jgi:hypothetical protein